MSPERGKIQKEELGCWLSYALTTYPDDLAFQGGRIGVKGIYSRGIDLGPRLLWFLFSTDIPKRHGGLFIIHLQIWWFLTFFCLIVSMMDLIGFRILKGPTEHFLLFILPHCPSE